MRPLLSLALLAAWLLLRPDLSLGNIAIGLILVIMISYFSRPLLNEKTQLRKPLLMLRLFFYVIFDISRSTWQVCKIIVLNQTPRSGFIQVPLKMRNKQGLAILSAIINSTPGTVWVEILPDSHNLNLHVFDLNQDRAWWIKTIQNQLERPLMQIFEHADH